MPNVIARARAVLCASAVASAALLGAAATPAAAADPAWTIIVFDGSGSMWGRISGDRESKFGVAREALRKSLPKVGAANRIGLSGFGHRRKADCSDVEVMLAPEPYDLGRLMAPLEKYNPKGKGPLTGAVKESAAALAKATGPASLILIHDDLDNCSQDPCALADELAKATPKITVHVVSIGLAKPEFQKMACLPRATGGRHFDAGDAASLATAIDDALKLAAAETPVGPAAVTPAGGAATAGPSPLAKAAPPPPEPVGPPGLKLKATLGAGGPAVIVPLTWRVRRAADGANAPPVATARTADFDLDLSAGSYVVDVAHGLVKSSETVEVKPKGRTTATIALQAGGVRVSAVLQKGMPALDQAVFAITELPQPGNPAPARTVWNGGADAPPVILPAGTWRVTADVDRTHIERQVTVTAGALLDVTLPLAAGRLHLRTSDREDGAALGQVTYQLTEDDAESASGRREVARSAAAEPDFVLPAGTYYLTVRRGTHEVRDRVLINAGDDIQRTLIMPLGQLGLQSRLAGGGTLGDADVGYRIERLDARQDPIRITKAAARIQLPPGRYRVASELGGQNVRVAREVDVRQGAQTQLSFDLMAATVQVKLAAGQRSGAVDVAWNVRDAQGNTVWRALQPDARAFLAPGKYVIVGESRDRRGRAEIEVKAGETRVVEVSLD